MTFYIFHRHRVCLVDHVGLICSLYSWWEDFESSSLATLPLGFNCGFISTSTYGSSTGVQLLRLSQRVQVCLCEGQVWRWCSCLGCRGSGSTRYLGKFTATATATPKSLQSCPTLCDPRDGSPPGSSIHGIFRAVPALRAAHILIWSYSCVFLPPMSTAIRTSAFSFVGALSGLLYIPQTQSLPS